MIGYVSVSGVWWVDVAALWAVVACAVAVGWALHGSVSKASGGTLDLSAAAARGELDLDWADPRLPAWRDDEEPGRQSRAIAAHLREAAARARDAAA